ncbi:MAG: NmrA family NAD(P)-binding protein [Actinomycetota bacterium]
MTDGDLDVVTGALSYTGRFIAARLLAEGRRVRTLTGHPRMSDPLAKHLEIRPYRFDDPVALEASLEGVSTLYNTYWVRFSRGDVRTEDAVENSRALFGAARRAGVARIVHVSVTNPSVTSHLPYFRGKALVERALAEAGLPYAIVRPTVTFGEGDVLINNIAWLLRRFPLFAIPGNGRYRLRPVHADDVARLCIECARSQGNVVVDAVGPETLTFTEMVTLIRDAIGSRSRLIYLPPVAVRVLTRVIGVTLGDVLLARHELEGMMAELVNTDGLATGQVAFSRWVKERADSLGRTYASELRRHFDLRADRPPGPLGSR